MIDRYVSHSMLTHSKVHCPFFSGCLKGGKKKRETQNTNKQRQMPKTQVKTLIRYPKETKGPLPRLHSAGCSPPSNVAETHLPAGLSHSHHYHFHLFFFPPRKTSIMKNEQIKVIQVPPFSEHSHLFLTRADPENGITLQRGTPRHP